MNLTLHLACQLQVSASSFRLKLRVDVSRKKAAAPKTPTKPDLEEELFRGMGWRMGKALSVALDAISCVTAGREGCRCKAGSKTGRFPTAEGKDEPARAIL